MTMTNWLALAHDHLHDNLDLITRENIAMLKRLYEEGLGRQETSPQLRQIATSMRIPNWSPARKNVSSLYVFLSTLRKTLTVAIEAKERGLEAGVRVITKDGRVYTIQGIRRDFMVDLGPGHRQTNPSVLRRISRS